MPFGSSNGIDVVVYLNKDEEAKQTLPLAIRKSIGTKQLPFIGYTIEEAIPSDLSVIFQTVITSQRDWTHTLSKGVIVSGKQASDEVVKKYLEDYCEKILNLKVYWGDSFSFSGELRIRLDGFE